ncbi:MAG: Mth938-like domain-containing protein [Candidatus Hadarchaeales archaeon]
MFRVDSYEFGRIVINGRVYTHDVLILPDRIERWWRKKGHRVCPEDLKEVMEEKPQILVVGRGYSGEMEVPEETVRVLGEKGIELVAEETGKAVESFNRLSKTKRVAAALHLTC